MERFLTETIRQKVVLNVFVISYLMKGWPIGLADKVGS